MLCSRAGLDNTVTAVAEVHRYTRIPMFLGAFAKLEKATISFIMCKINNHLDATITVY